MTQKNQDNEGDQTEDLTSPTGSRAVANSRLPESAAGSTLLIESRLAVDRLRAQAPLTHTNPVHGALLGRLASGRRTYLSRLNQVADILGFEQSLPINLTHREQQAHRRDRYQLVPWHAMRVDHVRYIKQVLLDEQASFRTINVTLSALRAVAREVFQLGRMTGDDYTRIQMEKGLAGERLPVGRHVPEGEILALCRACEADTSPAGARDAAIIGMLYVCGLRRIEVTRLQYKDVDIEEGAIQFVGKRNKERKSWPDDGTNSAIKEWLSFRGTWEGPLFCPVNKGAKVNRGRGLSDQSIYNALVKRISEAGLSRHATPHDLRRSFVTTLLDAGKDLKLVADLAGHRSVETTAIYDRRSEGKRKEAQSAMHLPYRREAD